LFFQDAATVRFSGRLPKYLQLSLVLELKRPGEARWEIDFAGDKAIQVYDGTNGWKLRPFLGRRDVGSSRLMS